MQISAAQRRCANHSDRAASALCVNCRKSICQECATQWDGINFCVACLAARSRATTKRGPWLAWITVTLGAIIFFWVALRMTVWIGVLLTDIL